MTETLTDLDRCRADCHRAINQIVDVWPKAVDDSDSVGWRAGGDGAGRSSKGDHSAPTEAMALHPSREAARADSWLRSARTVFGLWFDGGWQDPHPAMIGAWHRAVDVRRVARKDREVATLLRVADKASGYWPPAPLPGTTIAGITVGERGNVSELCAWCGEPVVSGKDESGQALLRRINGDPYHGAGPGCYWAVGRARKAS